jgi:hypothetical protein
MSISKTNCICLLEIKQEYSFPPPVSSGVRVTRSLVLCVGFVLYYLAIVLSVLLRFTDSGYLFDIFKLILITVICYLFC